MIIKAYQHATFSKIQEFKKFHDRIVKINIYLLYLTTDK